MQTSKPDPSGLEHPSAAAGITVCVTIALILGVITTAIIVLFAHIAQ